MSRLAHEIDSSVTRLVCDMDSSVSRLACDMARSIPSPLFISPSPGGEGGPAEGYFFEDLPALAKEQAGLDCQLVELWVKKALLFACYRRLGGSGASGPA